jgi:hypothetical protein
MVELKALQTCESVLLHPHHDRSPVFVVEMGGLRVCYLSSPDNLPSEKEIEALAPVDAVIALFDEAQSRSLNGSTLSGLMRQIGARILIPVPVVDENWRSFPALQAGEKVHQFPDNRVYVDLNSLPQKPEIWILTN